MQAAYTCKLDSKVSNKLKHPLLLVENVFFRLKNLLAGFCKTELINKKLVKLKDLITTE